MDLSGWAGVIAGAHAIAAMRTGHNHWLISEQDAKQYALALHNALRHLPVQVAQKYTDFAALGFAFVTYEMPRAWASREIWAQQRRQSTPSEAPILKFSNPNAPATPTNPIANGTGVSAVPVSVPEGPIEDAELPQGP